MMRKKRYAFRVRGGRLATHGGKIVRCTGLRRALAAARRGGALAVVEMRWSGEVWYAAGEVMVMGRRCP